MPTYTYRCANNHDIEAVQSFTDDPLTECPTCGAQLRKTYNSVGVVFKGSGFYRNDSRSESKSSDASTSSSGNGAAKPADGGGTKTESAPAAKTSAPSGSSSGAAASSGSAA